jgi:hypothetical protein
MQAAIGQQLKVQYEPPRELTQELAIILRKLDKQPPSTDEPTSTDARPSIG